MTAKIHPHWKNTEETTVSPKKQRVTISRRGYSTFASNLLFAGVGFIILSFVFMQGVRYITADITEGLSPDVTIIFTEDGFSESNVSPGDLVEFRNEGSSPDRYRTTQLNPNGLPLIEIPLLEPSGSHRITIDSSLAGRILTFVSEFEPLRRGSLVISEDLAAPEPPTVQEVVNQVPVEQTPVPSPEIPTTAPVEIELADTPPTPTPTPTPTPPAPVPTPTSPTPTPQPTPIINLGDAVSEPEIALWPALLRVNQFTVGSALIPGFSPTDQLPIHVVRETQQQLHAAANASRPPARAQSATGPGLWIVSLLSLCVLPLFLKKRV